MRYEIIEANGSAEPMRETDLIAHWLRDRMPGDRLKLVVLRDGERRAVSFPLQ